MHLWIDADACPGKILDLILATARRRQVTTTFVANKVIALPESPILHLVKVAAGMDVADSYIVEHAQIGDLVVTQDVPLAAELTFKHIMVISIHGRQYDRGNMADRLATRNLMQGLRDVGQMTSGPRPFSDKDRQAFANALDRALTKLLM